MEQQTCKDCNYYYQRYIKLTEDRYAVAGCGHCIYPRLKTRSQFTQICKNFRPREESPKPAGETET